jgi:putative FmdB family regulatory protein
MPTYEYECSQCKHHFDLKQGFHDKPQAVCPECKSRAKRMFHPTPIIFKGSGFYVTDHQKGGASATGKVESSPKPEVPKKAEAPKKTETKKSS